LRTLIAIPHPRVLRRRAGQPRAGRRPPRIHERGGAAVAGALGALLRRRRQPERGEKVTFNAGLRHVLQRACGTITSPPARRHATTNYTAGANSACAAWCAPTAVAQVEFNVISYRIDQVRLGYNILAVPNPPLPGRGFTVEGT
jgi:hypothetical protein